MVNKDLSFETLKIYWQHALVCRKYLVLCFIGIICATGFDLFLPIAYKQFFDLLTVDPKNLSSIDLPKIYRSIVIVGIAGFSSLIGWRISLYAVINFESRVMANLACYCFEYLHRHSYKFFADNFAGSLVKRINRFSAGFETIADQCTIQLAQTVIRIVCIIGILFWYNKILAIMFLVWTSIFVCFHVVFSKYKLKFDFLRAELDTKVTGRLSDTVSNNINLKLFAGLERELQSFKRLIEKHRVARYTSWKLGEISAGVQGLSIRVLEIVTLLVAIQYWMWGQLTIGDIIMLRAYLYSLLDKVNEIGQSVRRIYETMADANEMTEILLSQHEISDSQGAEVFIVRQGEINLCNVDFVYPGTTRKILEGFNLCIAPGEKVGIAGLSGGGKSTILKLVMRLHDVTGGKITVDGKDIRSITLNSLHRAIAHVPQDPILFHRSLLENIRYSRPEASDTEVIEAAKQAHCHEFISSFPQGYNTLVGERGIKLSGGEKQRVAIARAILMNAPILILDEASSSLDSESERFIQDSLGKLVQGRTVIAVAHRLATIQKMDRIVVITEGEIAENGSHNSLIKTNGLYQKLWELQTNQDSQSNDEHEESKTYIQ